MTRNHKYVERVRSNIIHNTYCILGRFIGIGVEIVNTQYTVDSDTSDV